MTEHTITFIFGAYDALTSRVLRIRVTVADEEGVPMTDLSDDAYEQAWKRAHRAFQHDDFDLVLEE